MKELVSSYKKTIVSTLIIVGIIIFAFSLVYGFMNGSIKNFFDKFMEIISPITIGFVIAYLSNPIIHFFEKRIFFWIPKFTLRRLISIIITYTLVILIIVLAITLFIPNLVSTVESFWDAYIVNYQSALKMLANRLNAIMDKFDMFDSMQRLDPDGLVEWFKRNFPWIDNLVDGDFSAILPDQSLNTDASTNTEGAQSPNINVSDILNSQSLLSIFGYTLSFGTSIFNLIKNLILGIFISIYMLMSKERFKAYFRRLLTSFLSPKNVRAVIRFGNLVDRSFGGFIEGQLLDALIVGIMTYIIFSLFKFSNPILLATMIAVTNIIPVFGPFIGGIPATFLVLLTQPEKTFLIVILLIVIQQIDGNLICPHILGDRINISSLTTIIAILTMGGLFGIFGMLIGVPVFAVTINVINHHTLNALRRKGFETALNHYHVGNTECISEGKDVTSTKVFLKISNITQKLLKKKKPHKSNIKKEK